MSESYTTKHYDNFLVFPHMHQILPLYHDDTLFVQICFSDQPNGKWRQAIVRSSILMKCVAKQYVRVPKTYQFFY